MRRIVLFAMSTITTLVLLFSYHTSTDSGGATSATVIQTPATAQSTPTPATTSTDTPTPATTSTDTPAPAATTAAKAQSGGTFTGDTVSTQWGPVQVQITVASGRITAAQAVQYPQGNGRDQEINSYALPVLNAAVVQAQSANLDAVSGATVTSDGYITSLQSAIDQAHL